MLSERFNADFIASRLLPREAWRPWPRRADRAPWAALPADVRAEVLAQGERALKADWPALPATLFLDFTRTGNRRAYEVPHFARRYLLADLVLAECVAGDGRHMDAITNATWSLCEESFWGIPAHAHLQRTSIGLPDTAAPAVDLFAAETAALLAWSDYLLGDAFDAVSPVIRPRLAREIEHRMLTPCLLRDDFWWLAIQSRKTNNWTPWIVSNWLACNLLFEPDPARRCAAVLRALRSLDAFIDHTPDDGGCDEGPSYWGRAGAALFDALEILRSATNGAADVFAEPKIREIARFICRAHIADRWFINFADAPARPRPNGPLIFRFGRAVEDADLTRFGAYAQSLGRPGSGAYAQFQSKGGRTGVDSLPRYLPALFTQAALRQVPPAAPLLRDVWLPLTQVMAARSRAGSAAGLFLAAKGGHNAESHNHNDIGQFVVFAEGRPVLVDAGVETYSRKTFGPDRYSIWTMQSSWHNLPEVNGVMQRNGREFAARDLSYAADDARVEFGLDIAGAYPPEAGLLSWRRRFLFRRDAGIEIEDRYRLAAPPQRVLLFLMTPCAVELAPGTIALSERPLGEGLPSGRATLRYDAARLAASCEEVPLADPQLQGIWGDRLFRIRLEARRPAQEDAFTLVIEGA